MAGSNLGAQVTLELSRISPLRDLSNHAYNAILDYARRARMSGSDIVVEEDLVTIFGRVHISSELEASYRDVVKIQKFVPLYKGCEIRLDAGAGPIVQNALLYRAYMATVIQLSLLTYFHNRMQLARMLSQAINTRFESRIHDALPDPGPEGIAKVLEAISSQTCAFGWHVLSQEVEDRLRATIPGFCYQSAYSRLSSNVTLGSMDFFYIVQSLPVDRRISLSTEAGCIPILRAHRILKLTVAVRSGLTLDLVFGDPASVRVVINWTGAEHVAEAAIKLYEANEESTSLVEINPENDLRTKIDAGDRHPLLGYGTTCLKRILNASTIVGTQDTIYIDSAKLIVAMAIRTLQRIEWEIKIFHNQSRVHFSQWQTVRAGQVLFDGLSLDSDGLRQYTKYSGQDEIGWYPLPPAFSTFLEQARGDKPVELYSTQLLRQLRTLAKVVMASSSISKIEDCCSMSIILNQHRLESQWFSGVDPYFEEPNPGKPIDPYTVTVEPIIHLLSTLRYHESDTWEKLLSGPERFLWSDFG